MPIYEPCLIIGDREKLFIHPNARVDSFTKLEIGEGLRIGAYVHIASFAHVGIGGGLTVIWEGASVASGARIISGSAEVDAISMSAAAPEEWVKVTRAVTVLRRNASVLCNAVVGPGVTIGQGAVLAAGGVAMKDIPDGELWGGVPARFIRKVHSEDKAWITSRI